MSLFETGPIVMTIGIKESSTQEHLRQKPSRAVWIGTAEATGEISAKMTKR